MLSYIVQNANMRLNIQNLQSMIRQGFHLELDFLLPSTIFVCENVKIGHCYTARKFVIYNRTTFELKKQQQEQLCSSGKQSTITYTQTSGVSSTCAHTCVSFICIECLSSLLLLMCKYWCQASQIFPIDKSPLVRQASTLLKCTCILLQIHTHKETQIESHWMAGCKRSLRYGAVFPPLCDSVLFVVFTACGTPSQFFFSHLKKRKCFSSLTYQVAHKLGAHLQHSFIWIDCRGVCTYQSIAAVSLGWVSVFFSGLILIFDSVLLLLPLFSYPAVTDGFN